MAAGAPLPARRDAELNVTPMLDVLLVLLVLFMLMAMRTRLTIDASLPVPCAGTCEGGEAIVLEVLPGPAYRINGAPVPASELAPRIESVYAGRPMRVVQVAGRRGATYQQVIAAMDVARGAGVRVIGLRGREGGVER